MNKPVVHRIMVEHHRPAIMIFSIRNSRLSAIEIGVREVNSSIRYRHNDSVSSITSFPSVHRSMNFA